MTRPLRGSRATKAQYRDWGLHARVATVAEAAPYIKLDAEDREDLQDYDFRWQVRAIASRFAQATGMDLDLDGDWHARVRHVIGETRGNRALFRRDGWTQGAGFGHTKGAYTIAPGSHGGYYLDFNGSTLGQFPDLGPAKRAAAQHAGARARRAHRPSAFRPFR